MKPEPKKVLPKPEDFVAIGMPEAWAEIVIDAGFNSPQELQDTKATKVHQMLNGFRKKNKLSIAALSLQDVESWY
jgi:lysyl-tRNA synthetase class 2